MSHSKAQENKEISFIHQRHIVASTPDNTHLTRCGDSTGKKITLYNSFQLLNSSSIKKLHCDI